MAGYTEHVDIGPDSRLGKAVCLHNELMCFVLAGFEAEDSRFQPHEVRRTKNRPSVTYDWRQLEAEGAVQQIAVPYPRPLAFSASCFGSIIVHNLAVKSLRMGL